MKMKWMGDYKSKLASAKEAVSLIKSEEGKAEARVEIESDLCKECSLCVEACPVNVLRISENLNTMGYHPVEYIGDGCTGCGICFYVCPEPGSIRVYKKGKR
jgi:NAD-dependent dihydropyrimidine dehydrogenase PreA subunit